MLIKKDTELIVNDRRKGQYRAVALRDFDTEKEEFYPVATQQLVCGMSNDWLPGDSIPCRRGLAEIRVAKEE